ncbi:MAG: O-methyltransferase [Clostridia bacterium]|nr:O-methyltransferase [Clostridia bacterium]
MINFSYAHKNTSGGERKSSTAQFNKPRLSAQITELRKSAFEREIPVSDDETLCLLQTLLKAKQPQNVLELGSAVGISAAVMLSACPNAHITTIERDESFYNEALKNFKNLGIAQSVTAILGDAGEEIQRIENAFDFIFLDCAKVQYVKYLPRLKKLLKTGGMLAADDVLLFGYVTGEEEVPKKRKMLVEHVKEYITAVTNDNELQTTILNVGNGVALSVKL